MTIAITACKEENEHNGPTKGQITDEYLTTKSVEPNFATLQKPSTVVSDTTDDNLTDDDGNLRTIEYYQVHKDELNKKLWECKNFSMSSNERYTNCFNAKHAFESNNN